MSMAASTAAATRNKAVCGTVDDHRANTGNQPPLSSISPSPMIVTKHHVNRFCSIPSSKQWYPYCTHSTPLSYEESSMVVVKMMLAKKIEGEDELSRVGGGIAVDNDDNSI